MVTIELKSPKKYEKYLNNPEFDSIIKEVFLDYVENKQDQELVSDLSRDKEFSKLNSLLEEKLWK